MYVAYVVVNSLTMLHEAGRQRWAIYPATCRVLIDTVHVRSHRMITKINEFF